MKVHASITVTLDLDTTDVPDPDDLRLALEALASVMGVQAEDGLYALGYEDADPDLGDERGNPRLADVDRISTEVALTVKDVR